MELSYSFRTANSARLHDMTPSVKQALKSHILVGCNQNFCKQISDTLHNLASQTALKESSSEEDLALPKANIIEEHDV